ncbi:MULTISPECIES: hypothetical protein [unclassified Haladaptatus]|uniref:hypothetical protein n=1 Tax=unclassified Haladaptatus TaxID=2622732 RepID=UPI00209BF177|nr:MULTISPECIES: hypothetical protein [unclassified Haladaptatus]MCO8244695.1 hypothetical protein [Haladaptatus sp. AB643]MCO8255792.1 hypothetical protein [Haladaptatus sp. AB618]
MKTATDEFNVQAYRIDEQITVVADLPGVHVDGLTVGFTSDPTALIIEVESIYRAQVPLPWESVHHSKAHPSESELSAKILLIHIDIE